MSTTTTLVNIRRWIIELTYLNKEGYVIYEYMVARKSPITPLLVLPLSSGFFFRRNLFFFEKNIADYRYEVSAVNDLVGAKASIEESLLKNNCTLTNENLEREMLDIFDMHIRIVESASISISTKNGDLLKKLCFSLHKVRRGEIQL